MTKDVAQVDDSHPDDMDLFEHLRELRTRLIYSVIAILLASGFAYLYAEPLFQILKAPFDDAFPGYQLIGTGPAEAFILKLKVSLCAGIVLACPFLFIQFWKFVSPGLHSHERKLFIPFFVSSIGCFLGGLYFCYIVVLPFAFEFFRDQYQSIDIAPVIRISEHLSLVLKALLGFGCVFELPVISYILARIGVIDEQFLIDYGRHAVAIIFLISAFLTPPDVLTQILMAIPLCILYVASISIARFAANQRRKELGPEEEDAIRPYS